MYTALHDDLLVKICVNKSGRDAGLQTEFCDPAICNGIQQHKNKMVGFLHTTVDPLSSRGGWLHKNRLVR